MFRMLFLALLLESSEGLALGTGLSKTLSKTGRPLVVHVWDKNPAELTEFAIDDVSEACRKAGASAVLVSPALVGAFSKEQEANRGNFPGPLPVIADVALNDLAGSPEELCSGAKNLGASALGLRYYSDDWPEEAALEGTLKEAVAAAEQSGLDTILLPEFGADGAEGASGAGELASRVGAVAGLTKEAEDEAGIALGCWDGSSEDLGRLREAGHKGLVLKNACLGDVAWGCVVHEERVERGRRARTVIVAPVLPVLEVLPMLPMLTRRCTRPLPCPQLKDEAAVAGGPVSDQAGQGGAQQGKQQGLGRRGRDERRRPGRDP